MINEGDVPRELSGLVVSLSGSLEATGDLFLPYRLVDGDGVAVEPVTAFFAELARGFYDFHLEAGTGPMVNPFPLARGRRAGRGDAHHNPMEPFTGQRSGRYRPKVVTRAPRCIPDERFDALFAQLGSHRDRALVALWVSTGARAAELLGATTGDVDPGQQLITVIRKGTRVLQPLPACPDAFVWLRLYQAQLAGLVPAGRDEPLWWTLRRPFRKLGYEGFSQDKPKTRHEWIMGWVSTGSLRRSVGKRSFADTQTVIMVRAGRDCRELTPGNNVGKPDVSTIVDTC